jgi:hypothetical protein
MLHEDAQGEDGGETMEHGVSGDGIDVGLYRSLYIVELPSRRGVAVRLRDDRYDAQMTSSDRLRGGSSRARAPFEPRLGGGTRVIADEDVSSDGARPCAQEGRIVRWYPEGSSSGRCASVVARHEPSGAADRVLARRLDMVSILILHARNGPRRSDELQRDARSVV